MNKEQMRFQHACTGTETTAGVGLDPGSWLTVDFHVEYVIFAVTRAVSAEAKALYSVCGRGKESEVMTHPA